MNTLMKYGSPEEIAKKNMASTTNRNDFLLKSLMSSPLVQFSGIPEEGTTIETILLKIIPRSFSRR